MGRPVLLAVALLVAGCAAPGGDPSGTSTTAAGPATTATGGPTGTTVPVAAQEVHLFFDFGGEEEGSGNLTGWEVRADVPADPNLGGAPVRHNVTACPDAGWEDHVHIQGHTVHSACFFLDGRQDDGTVWISRTIPVVRGASYVANVSVQAWGEESFNTVADIVLRLGPTGARTEADFDTSPDRDYATARRPLDIASGWTLYGLSWETGPLPSDTLVLDVGVTAIWETEMTRYLDAVRVDLVPSA